MDTEGTEALSMRRLGTELKAPATSINWHVAKDELIELVVHEVFGEVRVPSAEPDWRSATTGFAHSLRSMILRHPWIGSMLGEVLIGFGPNMMRLSEDVLAMLDTAGFSPADADHALVAYVIGTATGEAAALTKLARSGRDERALADALPAPADYPRLRQRYTAHQGEDPQQAREETFDQGLALILDGMAARLD